MANHFAVLGLAESLTLDQQDIDSAWQSLTRDASEAASDADDSGSATHEARAVLTDPVLRLGHWLDLHEVELERGATMAPDFMDLFSQIHAALEKADSVYQRHRKATTALARALLSKEAVEAQLAVQGCLGAITRKKTERLDEFPAFEAAAERKQFDKAAAVLGQLKFLKKWEQQCQEHLLKLIEC